MHKERQPVADRAELYLRSLLPDGYSQQQATLLGRVADLVEQDVVGERQVEVCGRQVPASMAATQTAVGERLVTRLATFQEWAMRNDCSLAPAMEFRKVDDSITDTRYRAFRLPSILMAEYRDDDLRCVTPHHNGDSICTVEDRIAKLEAGEPTTFRPVTHGTSLAPTAVPEAVDDAETDEAGAEEPAHILRR